MEVLDVLYRGTVVARPANDSDDIKAPCGCDTLVMQIIVDGLHKVALLLPVYGSKGIGEVTTATGLHLNKDYGVALLGYNVDVPMA